ncbi:hypothetical protein BDP81DRAFT_430300 [Colletotrichum phormii]|uniref:Uncharacterized protein n=1 Tax=Colletotrichum phormii TaxID=359342 RepID=A0AAI9ZPH5_9PEZI|nr:uncharacterized protein BDP81DRAFT_430300 [Colletotrichum phormii]KAK1635791.1 hypothetical protein BDP81DRAFT_430300 [Colletotrichum phormii]
MSVSLAFNRTLIPIASMFRRKVLMIRSLDSFNQIHFVWMCRHPNWQHWNIAYTGIGTQENNKRASIRRKTAWMIASSLALLALLLAYSGSLH